MNGEEIIAIEAVQDKSKTTAPSKALVPRMPNADRTDLLQASSNLVDGDEGKASRADMIIDVHTESNRVRASYAKYNIDEQTRRVWVQIIDMESDEVILEIPPEEVLNIARELQRYLDWASGKELKPRGSGG